jgi:hypothetical protein
VGPEASACGWLARWGKLPLVLPIITVAPGVALKAGLNVLVFKLVNESANWQGSVWITDSAGQPLNGIRVTLTPP